MPTHDGFDVLGTRWEAEGPGRYRGAIDDTWYQGRAIFGGLLAGILAEVCRAQVEGDRPALTLTVQFAAPAAAGAMEAHAEVARAGKHVTQIVGALEQRGRVVARALASFGAPRPHTLSHHGETMPSAPPPEAVSELGPKTLGVPRFAAHHLELRFCLGAMPFSGAEVPHLGGWCRLRQPAAPDLALVCALVDAWPPPALAMLKAPAPGASIDLTVHFLLPLPLVDVADDAFWLFDDRSPTVTDGYAEQEGTLWTDDGRLVARVRQMVAVF